MTETRDIELAIEVAATPEQVWRAIREAEEIAKWFAPEVRVTEGPTPTIFLSWGEGMSAEVPIAISEPSRRLRYAYGENPETKAPILVDWMLEGHGGTTTLRLVQSGFSAGASWDEEFDSTARGWRIFLANLKHYLERHAGRACSQRSFVVQVAAEREVVWDHIVSARGLDRRGTLGTAATGAQYHLETASGRVLRGTVEIFARARDLALTIADLDEALLRISLERTKTGTMIFGVVLAYGDASPKAAELASDVEATLRGALAHDPQLEVTSPGRGCPSS